MSGAAAGALDVEAVTRLEVWVESMVEEVGEHLTFPVRIYCVARFVEEKWRFNHFEGSCNLKRVTDSVMRLAKEQAVEVNVELAV